MTSYTGTLTGLKTSDKVSKDIQKMLEAGKLLTLEEFYQKWNEWLHTKYEHTVHSGLKNRASRTRRRGKCLRRQSGMKRRCRRRATRRSL